MTANCTGGVAVRVHAGSRACASMSNPAVDSVASALSANGKVGVGDSFRTTYNRI